MRSYLTTSEYVEYSVNVTGSGSPLKLNLVWTDYPGTPTAQGGLVNDLDLQVTDPSSTTHYPDNAVKESATTSIIPFDGSPEYIWNSNEKWAVKFTPSSYPAYLENVIWYHNNAGVNYDTANGDVYVKVYDDNGTGGLPGAELFSKTLTCVPSGYNTLGITGVTIDSGSFYITIEESHANQGLFIDNTEYAASYYFSGGSWVHH